MANNIKSVCFATEYFLTRKLREVGQHKFAQGLNWAI
jgi:hypothetical protein